MPGQDVNQHSSIAKTSKMQPTRCRVAAGAAALIDSYNTTVARRKPQVVGKKKKGGEKGVICMVGIVLVGPAKVVVAGEAEGWSPRHRDSLHVSKSSPRNRNGATRMGWWQGFTGFWGRLVQTGFCPSDVLCTWEARAAESSS